MMVQEIPPIAKSSSRASSMRRANWCGKRGSVPNTLRYGGDGDSDDVAFNVTVSFIDEGGKTRLTMRSLFKSAAERDKVVKEYGAIESGNQTLARLAEFLARM